MHIYYVSSEKSNNPIRFLSFFLFNNVFIHNLFYTPSPLFFRMKEGDPCYGSACHQICINALLNSLPDFKIFFWIEIQEWDTRFSNILYIFSFLFNLYLIFFWNFILFGRKQGLESAEVKNHCKQGLYRIIFTLWKINIIYR